MTKRILIIGAGEAGRMVAREIRTHPDCGLEVIGLLDDDTALHGSDIEGAPVLGVCDDLPTIVAGHTVDEAIISVPSAERDVIRRMVWLCRDARVPFKIVPGLVEIIRGAVRLGQIREVQPEDLLGRESVEFDEDDVGPHLSGKRVLVTGAGGSIGGEICRQLGRFDLAELQLLGRGENQIFDIEQELGVIYPRLTTQSVIGDIRDRTGLGHLFERLRPDIVFHAAAHKHVHYMERYPEEAIKNNVFGTANVIDVSRETSVERVVMLSTDKAVNPEGVMGASKRIAEYLMIDGSRNPNGPRLITVRFGNVLGSRGSVVPLFIKQIREGGPVTVSDENVSRFFMTLREACMLVVKASVFGKGGEIFILQMGTPIKIVEMAKDLIAMHGLSPGVDIDIQIVGLREGEKMHEDLVADGEEVKESSHRYILTSHPKLPDGLDLAAALEEFRTLTNSGDGPGVKRLLGSIIPDARLNHGTSR